MPKIMIVDDDSTIQMELEEYLAHMDYTVVGTADTGEGAIEMAREMKPDLVLMDINLPGEMDGISAAQKIKEEMDVAVVFITGFGDPEYIERAKMVEPFGYVMKPFDEKEINGNIEIALHKRKLELALKKANEQLEHTNRELKQEIEERKQTEKALRTSQQHLSQIINFLPDATFVIDNEKKVVAWNQAIENMTGVKAEEILGKGDYEYAIPFYGERRPTLIDLASEWNKEIEAKYKYVKKEGGSLVTESYDPLIKPGGFLWGKASLLYDHNGKVIGAIESIRDITDMKTAEEALRESEKRFRSLFEQAPEGIFLHDRV